MPPIRGTGRNRKPPPDGFDEIEDTLLEFANRMKDGVYDFTLSLSIYPDPNSFLPSDKK